MTPKITFTQTIAPNEVKSTEPVSILNSSQSSSKTDSRDLICARIEYLLAWAEKESFPSSLKNSQNN